MINFDLPGREASAPSCGCPGVEAYWYYSMKLMQICAIRLTT